MALSLQRKNLRILGENTKLQKKYYGGGELHDFSRSSFLGLTKARIIKFLKNSEFKKKNFRWKL